MHNSFHNFILKFTSILVATLCTFGADVIACDSLLYVLGVTVTQDCYHRSPVQAFMFHFNFYLLL